MPWGYVAAAVVGTVGSSMVADSAADAQMDIANTASTDAMRQLDAQVKQADELLAFNKEQYKDGKVRQVGIDEINKQVVEQNLGLSLKAGVRADETYDFYKTKGRPIVEKSFDDANNYDSAGNIAAARGRAAADVQQNFDNSHEQSQRALRRMGINPSGNRFLALQQRVAADRAAVMAGAETNAEEGRRGGAIQLRQQASNLAQGFPAQSLAQGAQSSGTGVAASGVAGAGAVQHNASTALALNGMQAGAGIYGSAAGGYSNLYNSAMNAAGNINNAAQQSQAGWGNLAGSLFPSFRPSTPSAIGNGYGFGGMSPSDMLAAGYADGGKVTGEGTGTSDSIPAVNTSNGQRIQLSNGEWIVPADVVKAKGTQFFQRLTDAHHKQVGGNLGRYRTLH